MDTWFHFQGRHQITRVKSFDYLTMGMNFISKATKLFAGTNQPKEPYRLEKEGVIPNMHTWAVNWMKQPEHQTNQKTMKSAKA